MEWTRQDMSGKSDKTGQGKTKEMNESAKNNIKSNRRLKTWETCLSITGDINISALHSNICFYFKSTLLR